MTKYFVNIELGRVTVDGITLGFQEYGLRVNADGDFSNFTDEDEITEALKERSDNSDIEVVFTDALQLIETGRAYFGDFRDDYDSPIAKQIIREFAKLDEEYEESAATDEEDRADREARGYIVRLRPRQGVEREIETPTHLLRLKNDGGKESHKAEVYQK